MAYDITTRAATRVENVGLQHSLVTHSGVKVLSGGVGTVTIPGVKKVVAVFVSAQSSTACYVSATSNNTFSIAGGTTDSIMWFALCQGPK